MPIRRRIARLIEILGFLMVVGYAFASCLPTPPGQIPAARGRIFDFSYQPLGGAKIQIFAAQPHGRQNPRWTRQGRALLAVSTDSTGAFDFSTLRPGTYFLEVSSGQLHRTLLAAITPRPRDRRTEIRLRLLGVECDAYEVITQ